MSIESNRFNYQGRGEAFTDPRKAVTPYRQATTGPQFSFEETKPHTWWDRLTKTNKEERQQLRQGRRALNKELRQERYQLSKQDKREAQQRVKEREKFTTETYRRYNVEALERSLARQPGSERLQQRLAQARALADEKIQRQFAEEDKALEKAQYARERAFRDKRREGMQDIRQDLARSLRPTSDETQSPTPWL